MEIDETKLNELLGQFVNDAGAVFHAATVVIGDRLGLYKAMADGKKVTPALKSLKSDGTWMIVEPFAHDQLEDNLNPVGRLYYSASTTVCTPASRAQEVGAALGAQAGEARLRDVVTSGGFTRFRRATETPFNIVFEARP